MQLTLAETAKKLGFDLVKHPAPVVVYDVSRDGELILDRECAAVVIAWFKGYAEGYQTSVTRRRQTDKGSTRYQVTMADGFTVRINAESMAEAVVKAEAQPMVKGQKAISAEITHDATTAEGQAAILKDTLRNC